MEKCKVKQVAARSVMAVINNESSSFLHDECQIRPYTEPETKVNDQGRTAIIIKPTKYGYIDMKSLFSYFVFETCHNLDMIEYAPKSSNLSQALITQNGLHYYEEDMKDRPFIEELAKANGLEGCRIGGAIIEWDPLTQHLDLVIIGRGNVINKSCKTKMVRFGIRKIFPSADQDEKGMRHIFNNKYVWMLAMKRGYYDILLLDDGLVPYNVSVRADQFPVPVGLVV